MKILSIDVGIKNLAFCLFEKEEEELEKQGTSFKITKWDIANISEKETLNCQVVDKNGECGKPAKFKKNETCFCLKHAKKETFLIPKNEQKAAFINKQTLQKLYEISGEYGITYEKKIKKKDLVHLINERIEKVCFQPIETTNASDVCLFEIGKNIKHHFDKLFYQFYFYIFLLFFLFHL